MIEAWLEDRRLGREQDEAALRGFVQGVLDGSVTRAQAAAWLAFVCLRGMSRCETAALTRAMLESGERLTWAGIEGRRLDKHSTGGVGDKVSLVLAPVWAALSRRVPMLSGRGLGITGGTLDKLESIPGFRTDLEAPELRWVLEEAGCFISGQTERLVPADRVLYALRDETGTVASVPLITASILSKKLAEDLDELVLDVKFGSGAFMPDRERAAELADSLVETGRAFGLEIRAFLTPMDRPLGRTVGNALEVAEAEAALAGEGPEDLRDLVLRLSGAPEEAARALDDGRARERWERMVRAQGGCPEEQRRRPELGREPLRSPRSGRFLGFDARAAGRAAFLLGTGRRRAGEAADPDVGLLLEAAPGDEVNAGQPLAFLVHAGGRSLGEARAALEAGLLWEEGREEGP